MLRNLIFRAAVHSQLKGDLKAGRIDRKQFRRLKRVATYDVCEQVRGWQENEVNERPILSAIWAFVVEYWDDILAILIKLAPLVLLDGEDD